MHVCATAQEELDDLRVPSRGSEEKRTGDFWGHFVHIRTALDDNLHGRQLSIETGVVQCCVPVSVHSVYQSLALGLLQGDLSLSRLLVEVQYPVDGHVGLRVAALQVRQHGLFAPGGGSGRGALVKMLKKVHLFELTITLRNWSFYPAVLGCMARPWTLL